MSRRGHGSRQGVPASPTTLGVCLWTHVVTPVVVGDSVVSPTGARVPARGRMRFQGSGEAELAPKGSGETEPAPLGSGETEPVPGRIDR
jgi:hypothetical protein